MDLFQIVNNKAVPSVHALLIPPFKQMWENDISEDKEYVTRVFSYIELVCNPKKSNPFAGYSEEERPKKVKALLWGEEDPEIDEDEVQEIMYATLKYKELLLNASPAYQLYVSAVKGVDKLKRFLDNYDPNERNSKTGMLILKPADYANALSKLNEVEKNMQTQRDKVQSELTDNTKTRNQREIGPFER